MSASTVAHRGARIPLRGRRQSPVARCVYGDLAGIVAAFPATLVLVVIAGALRGVSTERLLAPLVLASVGFKGYARAASPPA